MHVTNGSDSGVLSAPSMVEGMADASWIQEEYSKVTKCIHTMPGLDLRSYYPESWILDPVSIKNRLTGKRAHRASLSEL